MSKKNAGNHSGKVRGKVNNRDKALQLQNMRNNENNGNEANIQNIATGIIGQNSRNNYN